MTGTEAAPPTWTKTAVSRLRGIAMANLFTWVLSAVIAAIAYWVGQPTLQRAIGIGLLAGGGLVMLGGGNVLERSANLSSSSWGVSVNRHRDEETKDAKGFGDLTSVGVALFAGIPNGILGMFLMS